MAIILNDKSPHLPKPAISFPLSRINFDWYLYIIFLWFSFQVVINIHKAFVRFGLVHIVATNLCVWAYTSILETSEDFRIQSEKSAEEAGHSLIAEENNHANISHTTLPSVEGTFAIYVLLILRVGLCT